jgi:predicted ATPase/class 3 adenylate cyclase
MTDLPSGTVTFLFTDIEGSTRLLQDLGDDYGGLLDAHGRILRAAIDAGDGVEVNTEGDSFFAVFTTPGGALRAAVQAQRALAEEGWADGRRVRVRMGLHTGTVQLRGRDYVGLDVHRAARIGAAGHGGQVLLSDATRALVEPELPADVGLRDLGRHRLKDLEHPEHLYDLAIAGLPGEFPPLRTLDVRPMNLPAQRTSFVGREGMMAEVGRLLGEHRLVTLTGPGGTGKTRLAVQVAGGSLDRFPDGAYFVDLSALVDPRLVPSTIAAAMRVRGEIGRDVREAVFDYLRDRDVLLVLDNFEQIADAALDVSRLLDEAPRLHVLATSRAPLHVSGEQEYPVPPLNLPDAALGGDLGALGSNEAVALFVERAAAARPDFRLTPENAAPVAELTVRLDGLPLAIELAASRAKLLDPKALLAHLDRRLPLLTGRPRDVPARQQTLRGAIEWSWDLLGAEEQRLFERLGVFSGGWTVESADAVCQPGLGLAVLDGLTSLVDQSLVREAQTSDGEPRFRMLETIAEFAAERLARSTEEHELRRRHADHFARLAEEGQNHLLGADRVPWLARLDAELDNIRAALDWAAGSGDEATGRRICTAMWRYWHQRRRLDEGRRWLDRFVRPGEDAPRDAPMIRALGALGGIAYWQHDYAAMRRAYEEALDIARELDEPALLGRALYDASFIAAIEHDAERNDALLREARTHAERAGDRQLDAEIATANAFARLAAGGPAAAIEPLVAAIAVQRSLGLDGLVADQLIGLGGIERRAGRTADAARHLGEALTIAREDGDVSHAMGAFTLLALVATSQSRYERAARLTGAAARKRDEGAAAPPPELIAHMGDPDAEAREGLGDEAFEAARAEGYAMTMEEAVAFALEGSSDGASDRASDAAAEGTSD